MSSTYGERVKTARLNAGLSQSDLGRHIGLSAQAIQYLEDPEKNAQGSNKTARIADLCGVSALWLETGEGEMNAASSPGARYQIHTARSISQAIAALRPELRNAVGMLIANLAPASSAHKAGRSYSTSGGESGESVRARTTKERAGKSVK